MISSLFETRDEKKVGKQIFLAFRVNESEFRKFYRLLGMAIGASSMCARFIKLQILRRIFIWRAQTNQALSVKNDRDSFQMGMNSLGT